MTDQVQTLPQAPEGGAVEAPYTAEQLAEMQAIPSREYLSDGKTKNPYYNPRMDPGSDRWDAHAYFKAQPQVEVLVHKDPEAPDLEVFGMSINGFTLPCYPGHVNRMPRDFAELLRNMNYSLDYREQRLMTSDGALTLSIAGEAPRTLHHKIAS